MNHSFSFIFFLRKAKPTEEPAKKVPIYLRITVDSKRLEISTQRKVDLSKWNPHAGRALGSKEEIKILNTYLDSLERKLYQVHHDLVNSEKSFTAETIKNLFLGIDLEKPKMLLEIIQEHNDAIKKLIGLDYSRPTWVKYNTTQKHLTDFIAWKYHREDLTLKELNYEFISEFEFYLKSEKRIDVNTNAKYIKNLKKIIRECVAKDWLAKDPFLAYKLKTRKVERECLTESELERIESKMFSVDRLEVVRDIFLFSCYTGLAYIDASQLRPEQVVTGPDGEQWIYTKRQKTNTPSRVPLLPKALAIIYKYSDHPKKLNEDKLLPFLSNQKVNAYLKEIADVCGIKKELTFHIARHTFATTVTLNKGVSMESVSKMLGHKKMQTTQIYAKVIDQKVGDEMKRLKNKND